jgi:inositol hexakisphosphate/diphosphoinositol-pentakisphosphate kinase
MDYLDTVSELDYLTQIVIMLYEDSEGRFHVKLHFSPGAYSCFDGLSEVYPILILYLLKFLLSR